MKENDIRPNNLMQEYKKLQIKDIEGLLLQKDKFVFVGCTVTPFVKTTVNKI